MDGYSNGYTSAVLKTDVAKALWVRILHHPPEAHYRFRTDITPQDVSWRIGESRESSLFSEGMRKAIYVDYSYGMRAVCKTVCIGFDSQSPLHGELSIIRYCIGLLIRSTNRLCRFESCALRQ